MDILYNAQYFTYNSGNWILRSSPRWTWTGLIISWVQKEGQCSMPGFFELEALGNGESGSSLTSYPH